MRSRRPLLALSATAVTAAFLVSPAAASTDRDRDGVPDGADNCAVIANPDQADRNGNGVGDACDDPDNDTLSDRYELNSSLTDPDNPDTDGDGLSDGHEIRRSGTDPNKVDTDGDGVGDKQDNCATTPNASQRDLDGDGRGDACQYGIPDEQPAPVPLPELGPVGGLLTDLSVLSQDGVMMTAVQTSSRTFTLRFNDAATAAPLALDLPAAQVVTGGPVEVLLYDGDGQAAPADIRWKYFSGTRTLAVELRGALPPAAAVRASAPLFAPVCTSPLTCTARGAGFYNPLQRTRPTDAGDAVPAPAFLA